MRSCILFFLILLVACGNKKAPFVWWEEERNDSVIVHDHIGKILVGGSWVDPPPTEFICPIPEGKRPYYYLHKIIETDSAKRRMLLEKKVQELRYVAYTPYAAGMEIISDAKDSLFWEAAIEGLDIAPVLIDHLDDTTTSLAPVFYHGGKYKIADLSLIILYEMLNCNAPTPGQCSDFNMYDTVTNFVKQHYKEYDDGNGDGNYYEFMRKDIKNRRKFKSFMLKWWQKHSCDLVFVGNERTVHANDANERNIVAPLCGEYRLVKH